MFIAAADEIDQRETRLRVHHVIMLADYVEHWASDIPQADGLATDLQATLSKEIVLEETLKNHQVITNR